jgi:membrane protein
VNALDRLDGAVHRRLVAARRRWPGFDHLCRALDRYNEVLGGRLAAAIAYYGFFAVFALALIGYAVFGLLIQNNVYLTQVVQRFLAQNLPFLNTTSILESGRTVGVVGLVGLFLTGVGWVEAIRSSQRAIWGLNQQPGNLFVRRFVDLTVLIGVLLLVAASFAAVYALEALLRWATHGGVGLTVFSWVLSVAVNIVLAAALLVAVPRLRMTMRRLRTSVLLVGLGITLLNTVGKFFVGYVQHNPAYALVGGAVGLLVYLYVFNQMLLFGAAWAATSRHGPVVDFSRDRAGDKSIKKAPKVGSRQT